MKWISVKERLPEEGMRVLTCCIGEKFTEYSIDYIVEFENDTEKEFIWACRLENDCASVTHWMPLPQPPQI